MTISTKFADTGSRIDVLSFDDESIKDRLKAAVYSVGFNMMTGFFLNKKTDRLTEPATVYGSVRHKADKIMRAYANNQGSFGVLLSGDKGSGKTMTSSLVANRCINELGLPVILVEDSFDASGLAAFIEKLGECVVFFDEFGKKFDIDDDEQGSLLGLFDGTGSSRRMVLLTENSVLSINNYMLNRPGRVHYHFRHEKLEEQVIREYCSDRGVPETVIEQLCIRREASREFSFDVLQAIVDEYLLFGGDVDQLCEDLNIEPAFEYTDQDLEVVEIFDATAGITRKQYSANSRPHFPAARRDSQLMLVDLDDPDDVDFCAVSVRQIVDKKDGIYTFATQCNGHDIILKARAVEHTHSWYAAA